MEGSTKIEFANTLRGFAALSVLIAHYFGVFWVARPIVSTLINSPELPLTLYATPTYITPLNSFPPFNFGSFGVALFFIISGFVIPFSLKNVTALAFLANRILRIYPTYIFGFSITLLALAVTSKYFGTQWPYSIKEVLIHYIPGLRDLAWSRNIDGIIWTLEIELKFYIICAISAILIRRGSMGIFVVPVLLAIGYHITAEHLTYLVTINTDLYIKALTYLYAADYLIFMFIGVAFHYMIMKKISLIVGYFTIGLLFGIFTYLWKSGPSAASFYLLGSYGAAILSFCFAYTFPNLFKNNPVFDFLANISYPLYVVHGVAGYATLRILLDLGVKAWLSLIIATSGAIFVAWLIHLLIESPSQKLGKRLGRLISGAIKPEKAVSEAT